MDFMPGRNKTAYILFFVFAAVFILIAIKGLFAPQPGDENVYYYMAKMVSEGKMPYKDFFFAHPPLQIYLVALAYKVFGFNIAILKLIPLISALVSSFFIFKIAKEKLGHAEAVASSLLFLFSYSIMFNSVFSFGIELAAMLLVIGTYLLSVKNKPVLAGLFFGLAGTTRLLSLIPIAVIIAFSFFSNKKNFLKLSSAFLAVFLAVNCIFLFLFGSSYLTPVYKFHLLKSFGSRDNFKEYFDIIKLNWILFFSALLLIFLKKKREISTFAIISVIYLVFLFLLKKIFGFYFIVAFPFLAIMGGYSIVHVLKEINLQKKLKILILMILLLIFAWNLAADTLFLERVGFKGFERGSDLADFVNANSGNDTFLFGDESVVPLIALLTNKRIALDFVDTNNEVFISGVRNLNDVLGSLKGKDILFIIRSGQGISYFKEVREFLNANCEFLSQFNDKTEGSYIVYRCGQ